MKLRTSSRSWSLSSVMVASRSPRLSSRESCHRGNTRCQPRLPHVSGAGSASRRNQARRRGNARCPPRLSDPGRILGAWASAPAPASGWPPARAAPSRRPRRRQFPASRPAWTCSSPCPPASASWLRRSTRRSTCWPPPGRPGPPSPPRSASPARPPASATAAATPPPATAVPAGSPHEGPPRPPGRRPGRYGKFPPAGPTLVS